MAFTCHVFAKNHGSSAEDANLAVTDADLDHPGQLNVELAARDRMPVSVESRRNSKQYHLLSWHRGGELYWRRWRREFNKLEFYVNIFKVRLASGIAIDAGVFHRTLQQLMSV